jgi:hypothetical protein
MLGSGQTEKGETSEDQCQNSSWQAKQSIPHTVQLFQKHDCYPPPNLLTSLAPLRRFDTIEVIEAELQAALNTLTEHDFQNAFRKWQTL